MIILTPTALPNLTGNAITAERWRHALSQKGIGVDVIETQNLRGSSLADILERFRPHVVHAHHISRAGAQMLDPIVVEKHGHLPLVVSSGGTDINLHIRTKTGMRIVNETCHKARFVIAQSPEAADLLQKLLPDLKHRIVAVPKSFLWLGNEDFDLRAVVGCRQQDALFFMPAGIRPVKGNLECLYAMEQAHAQCPRIRVVFAGPALDVGYANRFEREIWRRGSFAKWILQISPKAMHASYEGADVILNHSASEGVSNSLLEAVAAGKPVLASDIPGNRWLIRDEKGIGPCGRLFNLFDSNDFVLEALRLAEDSALRESLAANSRIRAAAWPQPSEEAQELLNIYEVAIASSR